MRLADLSRGDAVRLLVDVIDEHVPPSKRGGARQLLDIVYRAPDRPPGRPETAVCRGCGVPVAQTPGAKQRVWHSEACRSRYRRDRIRPDDG